ncbi:hypothetical protein [Streptomyces sp. NPDC050485]|uniref:hypothetical protein n=1 Tax=Streptomyces sp. NPDC050485 TaxID=3365617 RepID=UPI0037B06727
MHAGHDDVISVCADAEALLRAGRNSEARKAARAALYTDGPDPRLYALLGRAHAAEADQRHTDRAEAILREGLATFPEDPVLLAAYTDLRAAVDQAAAPELAAPPRELSPERRRAAAAGQAAAATGADPSAPGPANADGATDTDRAAATGGAASADRAAATSIPVTGQGGRGTTTATSAGRRQRHDARLVLAVIGHPIGAAQQARGQAQARPADDRIAVLAETLSALARPGRAPLRLLVRAPLTAGVGCWAWFAGWLLAVAALHLPAPAGLAALLGPALFPLLHGVLWAARHRARDRAPAAPAGPPPHRAFPVLPPVPPYTPREKAAAALVLAMVAVALAGFALTGN